jgi:hypothetical protein
MQLPQTWQDWVFSVGQLVFLVALLPCIIGDNKPEWSTSLITAITLSFFAYTYTTLRLTCSALTAALVAGAWWVLFVQVFFSPIL